MRVAKVIINRPAKQLHKPLSYLMPEMFGNVLPGTRVLIPLGNSREEGILIGYEELLEPPEFKLRNIVQVLDNEPWFTPVLEDFLGKEIPGEVESLLFCVQTGIGVGIIAFCMGRLVERKKWQNDNH